MDDFFGQGNSTDGGEDPFADFDDSGLFGNDSGGGSGGAFDLTGALDLLKVFTKKEVMGNIEDLIRESYKFIRLADDLHDIRGYLNDIRLCFIVLTISGYVGVVLYALVMLCTKNRKRNHRPPPHLYANVDPDELHSIKTERTEAYTPHNPSPYHNSHSFPNHMQGNAGPPTQATYRPSRRAMGQTADGRFALEVDPQGSPQIGRNATPLLMKQDTLREDPGEM